MVCERRTYLNAFNVCKYLMQDKRVSQSQFAFLIRKVINLATRTIGITSGYHNRVQTSLLVLDTTGDLEQFHS